MRPDSPATKATRPRCRDRRRSSWSRKRSFVLFRSERERHRRRGGQDAGRSADDWGQAAPSRSTAFILVPEKELRALSVEKESALSLPRRWVFMAAAILIVIGSLVGGAGYLAGRRDSAALQAPPALRKFDPPPETTAQAPAAEQTADAEPATPAAAEQTASAAAAGGENPRHPRPKPRPLGSKLARSSQLEPTQ